MKSKGLEKLKKGDFNTMNQEWQPDGSVIIILTSRKWEGVKRFRVKDFCGKNEQEVDIATGKPIAKRDIHSTMPEVPEKGKRLTKGQSS